MAKRLSFVCAGLLCLVLPMPAASQLVFDASPSVRVQSDDSETSRQVLPKDERMEYRVTIIHRDGRYYWASRENVELAYHGSGAGHFFISPGGAGYVKVFDTHFLPADARGDGPRFWYMEHLVMPGPFGTITYWGTADSFDP